MKIVSPGLNVVMTVIGFAVSTMFIVFVCTRLICARIHLNASRRSSSLPVASRSDLSILERGLHGLESVVIANFPTKKYTNALFASSEDAKCTVCLADYVEEDTLRILPYCGHSFHAACIDRWLQQHSTCPICRVSLREFPQKRHMPPMFSSAVRSPYGSESFEARADIDSRMQFIHNSFVSEGDGVEARENITNSDEERRVEKSPETKHVESPSYT